MAPKAKKKAKPMRKPTLYEGTARVTCSVKVGGIPARNEREAERKLCQIVDQIVDGPLPRFVLAGRTRVRGADLYVEVTDIESEPDGWGMDREDDQ